MKLLDVALLVQSRLVDDETGETKSQLRKVCSEDTTGTVQTLIGPLSLSLSPNSRNSGAILLSLVEGREKEREYL